MNENLDSLINKKAYDLVSKIEKNKLNEIEKSLGVLSNDGVYAFYVYLKSKKIDNLFLDNFKDFQKYVSTPENNWQKFFANLSNDINKLLFFKEIIEKALIYARYHAKAKTKGEKDE